MLRLGTARELSRLHHTPRRRVLRGVRDLAFVTVGIRDAFVNEPLIATALRVIEQEIESCGRNLLIADVPAGDRIPSFLTPKIVDGVIVCGPDKSEPPLTNGCALIPRLERLPHVWLFGRPKGVGGHWCSYDPEKAGRMAAEHLHAFGHRRLAFFSPQPAFPHAAHMKAAFVLAARRLNCAVSVFEAEAGPSPPWPVDPSTRQADVEQLVTSWFMSSARERATAIFVAGDRCVRQVYHSLHARRCHIGRDISVMFCGTDRAVLTDIDPSPATITMNAELIGLRAAADLLWSIAHPNQRLAVQLLIEPTLLPGDSVGAITHYGRRAGTAPHVF